MSIFTGSGVAIVTPFTEDGVDIQSLNNLVEWQIEEGTDAIIACGTTGEPPTMTREERNAVIAACIKQAAGRVPVIAGTGGNNTAQVIIDSKEAERLGADALLVVTPYYNKATPKGLVAHYHAVAEAVSLPIILYNVPTRTGLNATPAVIQRIAEHPRVRAVKEASANIEQITELARLCPGVDIYSGNDDHIVPLLALGALGVISVVANVAPRDTHELVARFLQGDIAGSRALQFKLNPLVKKLFSEVNPIPVKAALDMMGKCSGRVRLPLSSMEAHTLAALKQEMGNYGLI